MNDNKNNKQSTPPGPSFSCGPAAATRSFPHSYLGHYASRDAFDQELLVRLGADGRIQRLPDWLQAYIRFDGEAVVQDFEQAGHFYVFDAPGDTGTFVFDAYERPDE